MQTTERINRIKNWIIDYCKNMPIEAKTLVIGVSGGIDSSVTSTLCALTGKKTIILSMPINQIKDQHDLSLKHQKWLKNKFKNVEGHIIKLDNVFDNFKNSLSNFKNNHGLANSRARLRMTTLYQVAASNNGIVVGTGNKVEDFGVGFFTKYGDGGVDLSPIADLLKTEVYSLSRHLEIDPEILEANPTDGLWGDDKTDEDQLGATYPELEWAMRFNGDIKSISKREKEVLTIYKTLNRKNQHKMNQIPVCKIPKSLK